jgi:type I restriction enzyme S subunit
MSRIDDLIRQHSPDGVEFQPLGEVGQFERGSGIQKSDFVEEGVGCIHYGQIHTHYGTWATETKSFVTPEQAERTRRAKSGNLVIATTSEDDEAVGKAVAWLGTEEVAVSTDAFIYRHSLDPKYVAYYFQTEQFHAQKRRHVTGTKVRRIAGGALAKIRIAVPPLEVQAEIVRVLDLFQSLEAELEARRRQYAHYRDSLLAFAERNIRWVTLADVCRTVSAGGTPLSTRSDCYDGDIPWLRTQEVRYADILDTDVKITQAGLDGSSARWVPPNCVIVAISGAGVTRGRVAVNRVPLTTNQHCCALEIEPDKAHYRYVYYWLVKHYEGLRSRGQGLLLLLQERITSVEPRRLAKVLAAAGCDWEVRTVEADERGTFLHSKFVLARCGVEDVCLQGSPNMSTPALLRSHLAGNIELANLLVGPSGVFDHLVSTLNLSPKPRAIEELGLELVKDDDADEVPNGPRVARLVWRAPSLTGVFDRRVEDPPTLYIGEVAVDDVTWELVDEGDGSTSFKATLGEQGCDLLARVAAVWFEFAEDQSPAAFPYHLNALIARASGQGRTDLLEHAGDFDLEDEELEQLLAQLDEVLVVDGNSLWRLLRKTPERLPEDGDAEQLDYADIDWDSVLAHPKLAQYRSWRRSTSEQTGLGLLLSSIAGRFKQDVEARRGGGELPSSGEILDPDLPFSEMQPEDEDAADSEEEDRSRRRLGARARVKRQFHSFIRRFVKGLADEQFVEHVGSSVVIPSYVVFNHLCWKLSQLEITDPLTTVTAQAELWRFFWAAPDSTGYLASLSEQEQLLALDILDAHHSEAVLLCSLFKAYDDVWYLGTDRDVAEVRDVWRTILQHSLWQPTAEAVADAATVLEPACESTQELVENLQGLAEYATSQEAIRFIEARLGVSSGRVRSSEVRVSRGSLGLQNVQSFIVDDPVARLEPGSASDTLGALRELLDEDHQDYIRVELPAANIVAFADFTTGTYVYADRNTDDEINLDPPAAPAPPWQSAVEALVQLAG